MEALGTEVGYDFALGEKQFTPVYGYDFVKGEDEFNRQPDFYRISEAAGASVTTAEVTVVVDDGCKIGLAPGIGEVGQLKAAFMLFNSGLPPTP